MIIYIYLLNQEVFESLGFTFDGSYWVKEPFPFKFQLNAENTYSVIMDGVPVDKLPKPVKTNSDVVQLMAAFAPKIIENALRFATGENYDVNKAISFAAASINKAFASNPVDKIMFRLNVTDKSIDIIPCNEETSTLLTGIQCKFEFTHDGTVEEIYMDPHAMSYNYLQDQFRIEDPSTVKLEVYADQTTKIPFFGTGVPKIKSNETSNEL